MPDRQIEVRIQTRASGARVATVTISNEAKLNTMTGALMDEFAAAIRRLGENPELRAVIVTGAGNKAFIGGADIGEMSRLNPEHRPRVYHQAASLLRGAARSAGSRDRAHRRLCAGCGPRNRGGLRSAGRIRHFAIRNAGSESRNSFGDRSCAAAAVDRMGTDAAIAAAGRVHRDIGCDRMGLDREGRRGCGFKLGGGELDCFDSHRGSKCDPIAEAAHAAMGGSPDAPSDRSRNRLFRGVVALERTA